MVQSPTYSLPRSPSHSTQAPAVITGDQAGVRQDVGIFLVDPCSLKTVKRDWGRSSRDSKGPGLVLRKNRVQRKTV